MMADTLCCHGPKIVHRPPTQNDSPVARGCACLACASKALPMATVRGRPRERRDQRAGSCTSRGHLATADALPPAATRARGTAGARHGQALSRQGRKVPRMHRSRRPDAATLQFQGSFARGVDHVRARHRGACGRSIQSGGCARRALGAIDRGRGAADPGSARCGRARAVEGRHASRRKRRDPGCHARGLGGDPPCRRGNAALTGLVEQARRAPAPRPEPQPVQAQQA
jgi:hypothetical protein